MIKVNGEALSKVINSGISYLQGCRIIDANTIAIAEAEGMQVQITITREEDQFLDWVQPGLVEHDEK